MRRILITGASTWTGGRLIAHLERRQGIEVFGVDEIPPRIPFSSPFAQLNMDRAELATHVLDVEPDTVVHLLTVDRAAELGRGTAHEQAVIGVQALFGAIGRSRSVRNVIVKSDAAIYPSSPRSPSVFSEATRGRSTTRYGRELDDLESLIKQLVPLHDHIHYTVLRLAPIFGATVDNPLSRYLRLPIIPTLLGFDPRLHILHEDDAVGAFATAVETGASGTFNVASGPPIYLSRIARLGKRRTQPLPKRGFEAALRGLARIGQPVPSQVMEMIHHGVVLDTQKMTDTLGFIPQVLGREAVLAAYGFSAGAPQ
jgi:UDP-glucose 4-epimerase